MPVPPTCTTCKAWNAPRATTTSARSLALARMPSLSTVGCALNPMLYAIHSRSCRQLLAASHALTCQLLRGVGSGKQRLYIRALRVAVATAQLGVGCLRANLEAVNHAWGSEDPVQGASESGNPDYKYDPICKPGINPQPESDPQAHAGLDRITAGLAGLRTHAYNSKAPLLANQSFWPLRSTCKKVIN